MRLKNITIIGTLCVVLWLLYNSDQFSYFNQSNFASGSYQLAQNFSCTPKKTCGKMDSCTEAYYFLKQCGHKRRDGDGDGIPCEKLCGKTKSRMNKLLDAGL